MIEKFVVNGVSLDIITEAGDSNVVTVRVFKCGEGESRVSRQLRLIRRLVHSGWESAEPLREAESYWEYKILGAYKTAIVQKLQEAGLEAVSQ